MPIFRLASVVLLSLAFVLGCSSNPPLRYDNLENRADYKEEVLTNQDGLKLFARIWEPSDAAKANVIILHGTALHGGLYENSAQYLVQHGYRVYAYDMQSWGRSEGVKGDGYVESFDAYALDLKLVLQQLRKRYPGTKNYVVGESLGGTVAMYTALKYEFLMNGVITSGVGFKPSMKLIGIRAPEIVNDMSLTMAKWWTSAFYSWPALESDAGLRFAIEDDALQDALLDDPYVSHDWLPGAYVTTTLSASNYIEKNMRHITVPVLLLHGTDDVLVPVASSQELYDGVSSQRKRIHVYDSPHAVLLEHKWQQATGDIIAFLDQQG